MALDRGARHVVEAEFESRQPGVGITDLRGAVLVRCDLSDAHFDDADLTGAVIIDCTTERTDWADCRR